MLYNIVMVKGRTMRANNKRRYMKSIFDALRGMVSPRVDINKQLSKARKKRQFLKDKKHLYRVKRKALLSKSKLLKIA